MQRFRDKETERVFEGQNVRRLPDDIKRRARMRLQRVAAATGLSDLRIPPSHRLKALTGDRKGQHSIRINDQWRVCFFWTEQGAWKSRLPTITREQTHEPDRLDSSRRTPGEILDELGISQYRLAKAIDVPPRRINEIVHGRRSITADTALRIGQALGMTPEFWLNLQKLYDLDLARSSIDIENIEPLIAAS